MIQKTPYLSFPGRRAQISSCLPKVAQGIKGLASRLMPSAQLRLDAVKAASGPTDMTLAQAKEAGQRTLVIGRKPRCTISATWRARLVEALEAGLIGNPAWHYCLRKTKPELGCRSPRKHGRHLALMCAIPSVQLSHRERLSKRSAGSGLLCASRNLIVFLSDKMYTALH